MNQKLSTIFLLLYMIIALTGCTVKQGQLVIIDDNHTVQKQSPKLLNNKFSGEPQKELIDKYSILLNKIKTDLIPLVVSPDLSGIFAYENVKSEEADFRNSRVIAGNMVQKCRLYYIKAENGEKKQLGEFWTLKSFQFDETGKMFAFIDGAGNVYIYELEPGRLHKIIERESHQPLNSVSWSRDSRRLMFDTRIIFDIATKEYISIASESYTPFIKAKYNSQNYIVQMKNNQYNNMIAFYDFNSKTYTTIAMGTFIDTDNINLIYADEFMNGLHIVNLKTLESKLLESGPIFNAKILKSTGEIIYTTINPDLNSDKRYILVKIDTFSGERLAMQVYSPTFTVSPKEDKLHLIADYGNNDITILISKFIAEQKIIKKDSKDLADIKSTILKMFNIEKNFSGGYEEYEKKAKTIYTNTYSPIPQEALENKLIDFRRFNSVDPNFKYEYNRIANLMFDSIILKENKASVNIGLYFTNSIELIKSEGNWYITGFSTHPESDTVKEIRKIIDKHIKDIKNKNATEALKYWHKKEDNEFLKSNRQIVESLMRRSKNLEISIGEIELWSLSEAHRVESPEIATYAKAKIIIKDGINTQKYKLILNKSTGTKHFSINSWNADPLSISQLF